MSSTQLFRVTIGAYWLCTFLAVVLGLALESALPAELQAWLAAELEGELTSREALVVVLGVALLVALLVTSIALFQLGRWALPWFLAAQIAGLALAALTGPSVLHPLAYALEHLATLAAGAVVAMGYWADVFEQQERGPTDVPA